MRKMKRARRWTGVLLAGFIGAGACFSGAAVTGAMQELTAYAAGESGILNNGYGGISININSGPYVEFKNINTWGQYAYTTSGCAWFASARVKELTGKGNMIYSGKSWYNTQYQNYGFSRGSTPRAKALACWGNHVAVVEAVNGDNIIYSEGGSTYYSDAAHGYCVIREMNKNSFQQKDPSFLGYVYLTDTPVVLTPTWTNTVISQADDNLIIRGRISFSSSQLFTQAGIKVWDSSGNLVKEYNEEAKVNHNFMNIDYDLKGEVKAVLKPGTDYTYQYYAVTGGKYYYSDKYTARTTGQSTVPVDSVSLDNTYWYMISGESKQFNATVSPWNATNKKVTWSSDNTGVAYVDAGGNVTAVSEGDATITVKTEDGGKTAQLKIFVSRKELPYFEEFVLRGGNGGEDAKGVNKNHFDAVPVEDWYDGVLYGTHYPGFSIELKNAEKQFNGKGVRIKIEKHNGNGWNTELYSDSKLNYIYGRLAVYQTLNLGTMHGKKYTLQMDGQGTAMWILFNTENMVAGRYRVSAEMYNDAGTTSHDPIEFEIDEHSFNEWHDGDDGEEVRECEVCGEKETRTKVVESSKVSLDKKNLVLNKGKIAKLTATVTPADAKDKTVTWSSSNKKIATVDSKGNVKGISQGKAKITAKTVNGKTATCDVRVLFSDVTNPKDWYYTPVYWAADNGITTGAGGKFAPTGYSTREQTVTFIWRMWGSPEPKNLNSKFSDVQNKKSYSYKAIMWANENGVVTGSKGKFAPGVPCTREQIVTILWRLAGKPEPKTKKSPFKDVQNHKSYSYKAILWASENGITTGANGKFAPANKCLRREMVTFLYRYNNLYKII